MIFVTVGTTHFDRLIRKVDELKEIESFEDQVVCQIGSGKYQPKSCDFFRFQTSIENWIENADLVISHGGTGSVLSLLQANKKFVAIANTQLADDHQTKFLMRLERSVSFPWGRDVDDLTMLIRTALSNPPASISMPHLADELRRLI